ncbi:hypothetical protein LSH36_489g01056 [Paralvinella palmiformis]|uniref:Parkin co-regulated protein n=1 Tax=Paralvinella palmiformis TaxID=53620 RepID=A0AAD9J970_9ANNE|nr:hypothetical protein LSH36_489g01056 [Paralvinella palmiformis]
MESQKKTPRGQSNVSGSLTNKKPNKQTKQSRPPKTGAFQKSGKEEVTLFRRFYDRSDIPVALDSNCRGPKLRWLIEIEKLDYHHFLPLFFDGMRDTKEPYATIATLGAKDMIIHAPPNKILNVVPQLIIPIKKALETKDPGVIIRMTQCIQELVKSDELVGEALVPYYRQILPVFNIFINKHNKAPGNRAISIRVPTPLRREAMATDERPWQQTRKEQLFSRFSEEDDDDD